MFGLGLGLELGLAWVLAFALALRDETMLPCPLVIPPRLHHRGALVRVVVKVRVVVIAHHRRPFESGLGEGHVLGQGRLIGSAGRFGVGRSGGPPGEG